MASQKELLKSAHGVTLKKISLMGNGGIVDSQYLIETLRTPETWHFPSLNHADARFNAEVDLSRNDPLVLRRLGK